MDLHTCPNGHLTRSLDCKACLHPKAKRMSPGPQPPAIALAEEEKAHAKEVAAKLLEKARKKVARESAV